MKGTFIEFVTQDSTCNQHLGKAQVFVCGDGPATIYKRIGATLRPIGEIVEQPLLGKAIVRIPPNEPTIWEVFAEVALSYSRSRGGFVTTIITS